VLPSAPASGTMVSGRAVPTAANRRAGDAFRDLQFFAKCSNALVNTSAAIKMTINIRKQKGKSGHGRFP